MMKNFKTKIIFAIIFLAIAAGIFGAGEYFRAGRVLAAGSVYFVDATNGNDNNSGLAENLAWKTLAKVNASTFLPGDVIKLKAGEVWRETLNLNNSGIVNNSIIITSYGSGAKPKIILSEPLNDWSEYDSASHIWRSQAPRISGAAVNFSYGILNKKSSDREQYFQYWESNIPAWPDFRFCGTKNDGYIYLKSNSGHPGLREAGARQFGINLGAQKNIVIDGIAIYGPEGNIGMRVDAGGRGGIFFKGTNVTVKNCEIKFISGIAIHGSGIGVSNAVIENNNLYGNNFAVYFTHSGDDMTVRKNSIIHTAAIEGDSGDRDAIGFNLTKGGTGNNILIEDNYIEDQGASYVDVNGRLADFAITIAGGKSSVIRYNHIKNVFSRGCIIHGDASSKIVEVYGNICDGIEGDAFGTDTVFRGIAVETASEAVNVAEAYVYNNLVINARGRGDGQGAAIKLAAANSSSFRKIYCSNNIFHNNDLDYELRYNPIGNFINTGDSDAFRIQNNLFYGDRNKKSINHVGYDFTNLGVRDINIGQTYNGFKAGIKSNIFTAVSPLQNAGQENYHLFAGSQAIDAGIGAGLVRDIENNLVPSGSAPDIGAHEYTGGVSDATPPSVPAGFLVR